MTSGPLNPAGASPGINPAEESERLGHPVRYYRMSVSAGTLALAWARQENAPDGATVVTDREVSPLGRLARVWPIPAERTLAMAVVLRPPLSVEEADSAWVLACLAAAEGAEEAAGHPVHSWWPDSIVQGDDDEVVGNIRTEIQLGPGKVRSAVMSARFDLERLGIPADHDGRYGLVDAVLTALDRHGPSLADGAAGVAAAYESRCSLLGKRIKVRMLPRGETRGTAKGIDHMGRLELESPTGMVERLTIDVVRDYEVV